MRFVLATLTLLAVLLALVEARPSTPTRTNEEVRTAIRARQWNPREPRRSSVWGRGPPGSPDSCPACVELFAWLDLRLINFPTVLRCPPLAADPARPATTPRHRTAPRRLQTPDRAEPAGLRCGCARQAWARSPPARQEPAASNATTRMATLDRRMLAVSIEVKMLRPALTP